MNLIQRIDQQFGEFRRQASADLASTRYPRPLADSIKTTTSVFPEQPPVPMKKRRLPDLMLDEARGCPGTETVQVVISGFDGSCAEGITWTGINGTFTLTTTGSPGEWDIILPDAVTYDSGTDSARLFAFCDTDTNQMALLIISGNGANIAFAARSPYGNPIINTEGCYGGTATVS